MPATFTPGKPNSGHSGTPPEILVWVQDSDSARGSDFDIVVWKGGEARRHGDIAQTAHNNNFSNFGAGTQEISCGGG
jgi:hypothetical protein